MFNRDLKEQIKELQYKNKRLLRQLIDVKATTINMADFPLTHISAFSFGNAGDNILVHAIRDSLNRHLKNKPNFIDRHVHDEVTREDIYLINQTKALLIGGGGLFLKDTNENEISGWQLPISPEAIKQIQSPIFMLAVGYNRFRNQEDFAPWFRVNINTLVEKAQFIGIRNNGSIRALQNYLRDDLKDK